MTSSAVASIDPARPGRQAAARCPSSARPRGRGHREHLFGWADTHDRLVGADLVLRQRQAQPRSRSPRPVGRSVTSVGMDGMTPDIASPPSSVSERRGSTRSGQILARLRYPVWHGSGLSGPSVLVPRHGATSPDPAGWPVHAAAVVDQAGVGACSTLPYSPSLTGPSSTDAAPLTDQCAANPSRRPGRRPRLSTRQSCCELGHCAQKPLRTLGGHSRQYRGESATWAAGHRPDTAPGLTAPTPPGQRHRSVAVTTPQAPRARTPERLQRRTTIAARPTGAIRASAGAGAGLRARFPTGHAAVRHRSAPWPIVQNCTAGKE